MKKKQVLTSLVAALFILSLFSGIASAQTQSEQYRKAEEQYRNANAKYESTKEQLGKARGNFETARDRLKSAADKRSRDELQNATKEYLLRAIEHITSHLEVLKNRIENSENKGIIPFDAIAVIDAHLAQLEALHTKVEAASSTKELRDAYQELKDLWIKLRIETGYYIGILLNHRIDRFVAKADNVSSRMDAAIQKLKAEGIDTAKLEQEASDFDALINEAKDNQQKTLDLFDTHSGFGASGIVTNNKDAQTFIRDATNSQKETVKKLKAASKQVLQFVKDFRKLSGGKVSVSGTGTLTANGSGRALIEGNVTVTLFGSGNLVVSSNANVTTDGTGTKEVLGNGDVKYQGFGSATIKGENIRVEISGNDISLTATGTGSAVLSGNGTYRTEKTFAVSGEWNREV